MTSKKKRNKRTKDRSRRSETMWSDLETAFFASAPPDEAEPPAAAESFDDLLPIPAPREAGRGAAATPMWVSREVVAIALASVLMLLSAVFFVS
jgi:hypothetical protein